MIKHKVSN